MSDKWACNNAKKFFSDTFKPAIDSLIEDVNKIYDSVITSMNSAAQKWAETTKTSWSKVSFETIAKTMDVSSIQENINGVRGIDVQQAQNVANKLTNVKEKTNDALSKARNAVNNCGFVGDNMASSLQESLTTIKQNVSSTMEKMMEETKKAIEQTVTDYSDTAGQVSRAFRGE